jgi:hypothetical protein
MPGRNCRNSRFDRLARRNSGANTRARCRGSHGCGGRANPTIGTNLNWLKSRMPGSRFSVTENDDREGCFPIGLPDSLK